MSDFLPDLPGFDISVVREKIHATGIQSPLSGDVLVSLASEPIYKYTVKLNVARGFVGSAGLYSQAAEMSAFFSSKLGAYSSFLVIDPVSGTARKQKFADCDGVETQFQVTNIEGFKARRIQTFGMFSDIVRHVQPTATPWELSNNAQWLFDSYGDGTAPVSIEVTPGETVKISATGAVSGGLGVPEYGPDGGHYDSGGLTLPSDVAGKPSANRFCGLVGAFCNSSGHVIEPIWIGSGDVFTVPENATRLQLGINDCLFSDDTGPGFTVTVLRSSKITVPQSDYSLSTLTGVVTFNSPPQVGTNLYWSGTHAMKVRFESDSMSLTLTAKSIFEGEEIVLKASRGQ